MAVLLPRAEISAAADFGCIPSSPESGSKTLSRYCFTPYLLPQRILLHEVRTVCVSVEEQNRSFPSGLDCLKMYVYPDVLQMLCFCHNKLWTAVQPVVFFFWGN